MAANPVNQMADKKQNDMFKLGGLLLVGFLLFGGNGGETTTPDVDTTSPADDTDLTPQPNDGVTCNYAPTFILRAQDKWDSTISLSTAHNYKINGGSTTAFAGTAVAGNRGDVIDVLWGSGNESITNEIGVYSLGCGQNLFPIAAPKQLVQNSTVTVECFDENNDLINDLDNNFSIGSGETFTIPCRLKVDTADQGLIHGAVMVANIATGAVYAEEKFSLTGDVISGSVGVPSFIDPSAAADKTKAWSVKPLMDTGYHLFNVYGQAESAQNPGITNDITLTLYSIDCYENADIGKFECGVENQDGTQQGAESGREIISID